MCHNIINLTEIYRLTLTLDLNQLFVIWIHESFFLNEKGKYTYIQISIQIQSSAFFISKIDKGKSKKKISQGKNDLAYNWDWNPYQFVNYRDDKYNVEKEEDGGSILGGGYFAASCVNSLRISTKINQTNSI